MKAVIVMLLMAVMLCTLATPAVAGEWIQGPMSGKPVYCDYFPEWNGFAPKVAFDSALHQKSRLTQKPSL